MIIHYVKDESEDSDQKENIDEDTDKDQPRQRLVWEI